MTFCCREAADNSSKQNDSNMKYYIIIILYDIYDVSMHKKVENLRCSISDPIESC